MGLPYIAVRGLLGTDILKHRPDLQVQANPFNAGEQVVVAQPIRPDIAIFHAVKADRWGNALAPGLRDDLMMARAARRVVVTAEQIVDGALINRDIGDHTFLPAIDVDMVAPVPFGAHPWGCGSLYDHDDAHCRKYLEMAQQADTFGEYLDRFVFGLANHEEYLDQVGLALPAGSGAS